MPSSLVPAASRAPGSLLTKQPSSPISPCVARASFLKLQRHARSSAPTPPAPPARARPASPALWPLHAPAPCSRASRSSSSPRQAARADSQPISRIIGKSLFIAYLGPQLADLLIALLQPASQPALLLLHAFQPLAHFPCLEQAGFQFSILRLDALHLLHRLKEQPFQRLSALLQHPLHLLIIQIFKLYL